MPVDSKKPLIFISYAHSDEPEKPGEGEVKWLSFVSGFLRPAIKHGAVDLWIDQQILSGADWERENEQQLRACDIFILLVSPSSLSSHYVLDREIPLIRERQRRGEEVHFYPLVLTPTPKAGLDLVRDMNLRPRDGKPLSAFPLAERYRQMSEVADEIADIAAQIQAKRLGAASQVPRGSGGKSDSPIISVSYASDHGRSEISRSVFISYRRDDSPGFAGRIYDRIVRRLGKTRVFFDIDNIRPAPRFH